MDLAIINTWLVTFRGEGLGIIENGAVASKDDRIAFVGKTNDLNLEDVDKIIDGKNHVTMPGLVNAHTHTGLTLLRGGAQDVPEIEWMDKALGPIAKHLTEKDRILGSKLGVLEGLRSGITTFGEYQSNVKKTVEEVYRPLKVRVAATETINEVVSNKEELGPSDPYELSTKKGDEGLQRANDLFNEFDDSELVSCYYGPQALDMVSLETLERIFVESREQDSMIHMHIAQGEREQKQIEKRYGKNATTVGLLKKNDMLNSNLIAVHCHGTSDDEKQKMVKNGVNMIGCPSSIAMIDGIVPPINDFLKYGGKVGLGTDQAPGPGTHNMFREMRTASLLSKVRGKDPTQLPCWEVLKLGCNGGAEVLGLNDKIGSLEEGKKADIITIDLSYPNLTPVVSTPFHNFIPNLVYSSMGNEVDNLIVNGEIIMEGGEFLNIDEDKIIDEANKRAKEIFLRSKDEWKKADSYLVKKSGEDFI